MTRQANVTIVGAGISGAACANVLRRAGITATLIDRAAVPGGRMASPVVQSRPIDTGAAYFTVADPAFEAVVQQWACDGLARTWTDRFDVYSPGAGLQPGRPGTLRWSAPGGLRSLVADLLKHDRVRTDQTVERVGHDGARPTIDSSGVDIAVLAMPDPQAKRLLAPSVGSVDAELASARAAVEQVHYSAVIAVTARWHRTCWPFRHGVFVNDHPMLSFVADDGARRGDGAPVLVSHTSEKAASACLDTPDDAISPVLTALDELFSIGPPRARPHAHRWTFAKPTATHGHAPFLLTESGIGLTGDSWCPSGSPRVEAAWLSGAALGAAIARRLTP